MKEELDWLTLEEGEKVTWSGQPRIKSIIPAVITGVPLILAFGLGLLIIAGAYLNVKNTNYVITNKGVYVKKGVITKNVQKVGFDKIQNISFSQGVLGNYFGYGNIEISTAGSSGTQMAFRSIEDPKPVQETINKRIGSTDTSEGKDFETKVLEKLDQTNELLRDINDKL
jgi:uncharacterized membrane protein YdbT with pleckstrin-like domain